MGIDARMFVRNKGVHLNPTELRRLSAKLTASIGAENFFLMTPGDPMWGGRTQHALDLLPTVGMLLANKGGYYWELSNPDEVEEAYGHLRVHPESCPVYFQDGPEVVGDPDEQFIKVSLYTRYYGPGYERGDWRTIRATAEFLELHIADSEVWYGGDSSGVCALHLNAALREQYNVHYLALGHEPYRGAFGSIFGKPHAQQVCNFCADLPMHDVGGGRDRTFWSCDGCDLKRVVYLDGRSVDFRGPGADFGQDDSKGVPTPAPQFVWGNDAPAPAREPLAVAPPANIMLDEEEV